MLTFLKLQADCTSMALFGEAMKHYQFLGIFTLLLIALLNEGPTTVYANPQTPLGPHCLGSGPLVDDYCGCTWGVIYYRGEALDQIPVQLQFNHQQSVDIARFHDLPQSQDYPYYLTSGHDLGARLGDILTVTVDFAGQTTARPFRALPETTGDYTGEQEITVVLPSPGEWMPQNSVGYTRTLLLQGQDLWAGGRVGLSRIDLSTGSRKIEVVPGISEGVVALAADPVGTIWVAGPQQLASAQNGEWQPLALPFVDTITAIAVDSVTGVLWVGGSKGTVAKYDGSWEIYQKVIQHPVSAITVAPGGRLWVGTWGGGVFAQAASSPSDNSASWQNYRIADGLASDYVYSAITTQEAVWFGTDPYQSPLGPQGGVSRYDIEKEQWHTYTTAHGLPQDQMIPSAPAPIYVLTTDTKGLLWAGTAQGIYLLATEERWVMDEATASAVYAMASSKHAFVAAQANGTIQQLVETSPANALPVAQITTNDVRVLPQDRLLLFGTARDSGANDRILAWDWASDIDGPLCTTSEQCDIPAKFLSLGTHIITLRIQDDEGNWSVPTQTTVEVVDNSPEQIFLPIIIR